MDPWKIVERLAGLPLGFERREVDGLVGDAREALAERQAEEDKPVMRKATVIVQESSLPDSERQVAALLPANYRVVRTDTAKTLGGDIGGRGMAWIRIEGIDNAGWTLDDYVIPRLASGLLTCREDTA